MRTDLARQMTGSSPPASSLAALGPVWIAFDWLTTGSNIVLNISFNCWYEVDDSGKGCVILNLGWCLGHETVPVSHGDFGISEPKKNLTK